MSARLVVRLAFGFADSTSRVGCLLFVAAPFNWLSGFTHSYTRAQVKELFAFRRVFVPGYFFHSSLLLHSSVTAFLPYVSCTPHFVWWCFFLHISFCLPIFSRLVTCPSSYSRKRPYFCCFCATVNFILGGQNRKVEFCTRRLVLVSLYVLIDDILTLVTWSGQCCQLCGNTSINTNFQLRWRMCDFLFEFWGNYEKVLIFEIWR